MSSITTHLTTANKAYVATHPPSLPLPPSKAFLLLTCMDARIDPAAAFGISLGDAHVVRNAGGSAREALRSIVISQQLLATKEVVVVKHTGCGMLTFKDEDAFGVVEKNLGGEAVRELKAAGIGFLPFAELDQAVRDDVAFLKASKAVPDGVAVWDLK